MERMERSFIKNGKEWKEWNVLLKRTDAIAQPWKFVTLSKLFHIFLLKASVFKNSSRKKCTKRYNTDLIRVNIREKVEIGQK